MFTGEQRHALGDPLGRADDSPVRLESHRVVRQTPLGVLVTILTVNR